jgi:hypothetical protein
MLLEEDGKNSIQVLMLFSLGLSHILLLEYGDFYIFMIRSIVMLEDKLDLIFMLLLDLLGV